MGKIRQKLLGQFQSLQDENYEDSSTDDTEDSLTVKNLKPKPGKLDLRQFDNITNAIRKLSVQSKKTPLDLPCMAQYKHQPPHEVAS